MLACVPHQGTRDVGRRQRHRMCPKARRQFQHRQHPGPSGRSHLLALRRLDIHRMPAHGQLIGETRRRSHHGLGPGARTDADQQGIAGMPDGGDGLVATILTHLAIDPIGGAPQRELAQGQQVAFAKKMTGSTLRLPWQVDLALAQALQQLVGWQIHQHDLISAVEGAIRHGFANAHPSDASHHLIQAFDVLDVDGCPDVDTRRQQFLDILPAFRMAAACRVAVGILVDQDQAGMPGQGRVQIEFRQPPSLGLENLPRQLRQALAKLRRGEAAMGFQHADQDIPALIAGPPSPLQHRAGLADAGTGAEKNLQPATRRALFLMLQTAQQLIRVGTFGTHASAYCGCGGARHREALVEIEIERQHIHMRFTEQAPEAWHDVLLDQRRQCRRRYLPYPGHPSDLPARRCR